MTPGPDPVQSTRFTIVGAGGLGGPVACALAAAGAGALAICDDDRVELSNLQRQIQFSSSDLRRPKAAALADELARRGYLRERVRVVEGRFSAATAAAILDGGCDVVIDGSDNLATKFAVNDAACRRRIPAVIGAVARYGGQVLSVTPGVGGCYRCLFEEPPAEEPESCAEAGVLGAAVAVIAGETARAALALARGGDPGGRLLIYDDLRRAARARVVRYNRRPGCRACGDADREAS